MVVVAVVSGISTDAKSTSVNYGTCREQKETWRTCGGVAVGRLWLWRGGASTFVQRRK